MVRVLIVDDEIELVRAFRQKLAKEGMEVRTAHTGKEALGFMKEQAFDVAVLDIKLPDMDGIVLFGKLKEMQPIIEVIMVTGYASIDTAIKSMKLGAYDYLTKPCKLTELASVVLKAYEKKTLREKNILLEEHITRVDVHDQFIGESQPIREVKKLVSVVAGSDIPVLVLGETGTGKELVARAVHGLSRRSTSPFVTVNSGNLQESILESELFGYKKGAFTGAQVDKVGLVEIAHGGTFFIDELGEMSPTIQSKFLRLLETGVFRKLGDTRESKVDVRFICATNKNLEREVKESKFREDLFYRLNTFIINLPPLRARKKDIPLLVDYFLQKFSRVGEKKSVSPGAMNLLIEYDWPGNVRELANVLERATLLASSRREIQEHDLPQGVLNPAPQQEQKAPSHATTNRSLRLADMESEHIDRVLQIAGGNKSEAARMLGISRRKLYRRVR